MTDMTMIEQKRVLIVDDAAFSRKRIANILAEAGFLDIIEACDGEEGLQIYETNPPDIIFLDLIMPRMDGRTLLSRIDVRRTRVIIVSAVNQEAVKKSLLDMGASGFVSKPFEEEEILRAIGLV